MPDRDTVQQTLASITDHDGTDLRTLNDRQPLLLALLRHTGCPFCVEAVHDLAQAQQGIAERGVAIAVVFQTHDAHLAQQLLQQQGLTNAHLVLDPDRTLYKLFDIKKGTPWQLFGPRVLLRVASVIRKGLKPARKSGGSLAQLPGTVLVHKGGIIEQHAHTSQADRADYRRVVCAVPEQTPAPA
jgi:hypothetical protein